MNKTFQFFVKAATIEFCAVIGLNNNFCQVYTILFQVFQKSFCSQYGVCLRNFIGIGEKLCSG